MIIDQKQKSRMRCLLVNPEKSLMPPFGLLHIASILEKRGNYVEVVDLPSLSYREKNLDALFSEWIPKSGFGLIGITCLSAHYRFVENLVKFCRKNLENIHIVVGGFHASSLPESFLRAGADSVVIGEGEETIVDLVDVLENGGDLRKVAGLAYISDNKLCYTDRRMPPKDLDNLPFPAYHLIDMHHYMQTSKLYGVRGLWLRSGWIMTSRGCIANCKFCSYKKMRGFGVRNRSVSNIVDELEFLVKDYKIKGFWILDDTFAISEKRIIEFCNELKRRKLKLKWAIQTRSNLFTETIANKIKSAGCVQAEFGVESGSQRVLDLMNKGITVEQNMRAFEICKKYKLRTYANIILGYPGETLKDLKKTKELLKKIKPTLAGFYFICPYPGTELYEEAIKNKWIVPSDIGRFTHTDDPILCVGFTKQELIKIREDFWREFISLPFYGYLFQPAFIIDMVRICLKNFKFVLKIVKLLQEGRRNDAINSLKDEIQKL